MLWSSGSKDILFVSGVNGGHQRLEGWFGSKVKPQLLESEKSQASQSEESLCEGKVLQLEESELSYFSYFNICEKGNNKKLAKVR